ncbi:hypothetical protein DQ384_24225 [Sphaerisporangium album]|uniref:Bacterial HORMA domain-containing protein n=1 Tax=Sphaerisporangium album TaxID=509200 RepID=A0A367FEG8_9ACTN|nr:hypothetical protein [Sphaerisporangium album]RCG28242.1 hypothetical protein DQ384_24225 [Sphaerisporangium album]
MSIVQTVSLTVTHVDVLYVVQQIKRDLQEFRAAYPALLSADRILDLHDAMVTFIMNDAITRVSFTIEDPAQEHLVLHELRYDISYTGTGPRVGLGGAKVRPVRVPPTARMTPFVVWSPTMRALPPDRQRRILQGTGWPPPGTSAFRARYSDGSWVGRSVYSSGVLAAESQEFRRS